MTHLENFFQRLKLALYIHSRRTPHHMSIRESAIRFKMDQRISFYFTMYATPHVCLFKIAKCFFEIWEIRDDVCGGKLRLKCDGIRATKEIWSLSRSYAITYVKLRLRNINKFTTWPIMCDDFMLSTKVCENLIKISLTTRELSDEFFLLFIFKQ